MPNIRLPPPDSATFTFESGFQKLGQPVPESNLCFESNNVVAQQMQRYVPSAWLSLYFPVNGRSVPDLRATWNDKASSCLRHSSSVLTTRATLTVPALIPAAE